VDALTGEVIKFWPKGAAKDPDAVLEQAIGAYRDVLVIGWDENGALDARSTELFADGGEILWLLESFRFALMAGEYSK
jgi:hypothetical protein